MTNSDTEMTSLNADYQSNSLKDFANDVKTTVPRETYQHRHRFQAVLLYLLDNLISGLIIGPLTVFYWRGTWTLLNIYCFPENQEASGWTCSLVGNFGIIVLVYAQKQLEKRLHANNLIHWILGFHLYTYVLGALNVLHWRGVWILLDHYTGISANSAWITFAIGQGCLSLLRSSRMPLSPPLAVNHDRDPTHFVYDTRFNTKPEDREHYFLDTLLTVMGIHQLIVFYWRSVWEIFDVYLYPDDTKLSAIITLVIAYVLHLLVCALQPLFNVVYRRDYSNPKVVRWALEYAIFLVGNLLCVTHWRGIWYMLDLYFIPLDQSLSAGLTHLIGFGGLCLFGCSHSITLSGCQMEGDSEPEEGCKFPNDYIRHFRQSCCKSSRREIKAENGNVSVVAAVPNGEFSLEVNDIEV